MSIEELYSKFINSKGVSTDTRKDLEGKLFFALKGENFNGNKYADKALENGAILAIVDELQHTSDDRFLLVDSVLHTLQLLSNFHRRKLRTPIIGITGSNGKTTSKELISAVLSQKYNTYSTKGNLNNHIGVPLSLLELRKDHEIAVIEMGANRINDIKELCEICEPDFGFITNIGNAHLEGFGGKEGVIKAKRALFDFIMRNQGEIFVNTSEIEVAVIAGLYRRQIKIGEKEECNYVFKLKNSEPSIDFSCIFPIEFAIRSSLYGSHNYQNLKMASAIGLHFNVEVENIVFALEYYKSENNRSQILDLDGTKVYLDAYNANPTSMKMALNSFSKIEVEGSKLLVLGDMLELGNDALKFHEETLSQIIKMKAQAVLVGPIFYNLKGQYPKFQFFQNIEAFNSSKLISLKNYNVILIKGSRGIKLEQAYFLKNELN